MKRFLQRHGGRITGTLSGFDRVLFRGTLRSIAQTDGPILHFVPRNIMRASEAIMADKMSAVSTHGCVRSGAVAGAQVAESCSTGFIKVRSYFVKHRVRS